MLEAIIHFTTSKHILKWIHTTSKNNIKTINFLRSLPSLNREWRNYGGRKPNGVRRWETCGLADFKLDAEALPEKAARNDVKTILLSFSSISNLKFPIFYGGLKKSIISTVNETKNIRTLWL